MRLVVVPTATLEPGELAAIHLLCDIVWNEKGGEFTEQDWEAALGGVHVIVEDGGTVIAHASVVPRTLVLDGRPLRSGYVEAVATHPALQRQGLGTRVMRQATATVDTELELGALSSAVVGFYERFGWQRWPGSTGVQTADGVQLTPDEDGSILVRFADVPRPLGPGGLLVCDGSRPGDVW
jgi:aminoglycoside 2'-N-acetyltransferase I